MKESFQYVDEHFSDFVEELQRYCRQPSYPDWDVPPFRHGGMLETAELLREIMERVGIKTELIPTEGAYPIAYGELKGASDKTILFDNHYDVYPPGDVSLWHSDPLAAEIGDGKLFARGVTDDKGSTMARVHAVEAVLKTHGSLPVSVKFIVEGKCGYPSDPYMYLFMQAHKDLVQADAVIWENAYMDANDRPTIVLGNMGTLGVLLNVEGVRSDNIYAHECGAKRDPAWRLTHALSTLQDERGEICIEGFYDDIVSPSSEDIRIFESISFDDTTMKEVVRKVYTTPSLMLTGFEPEHTGPYGGTYGRATLPAASSAKLWFRLVKNQSVEDVLQKLRRHLDKHGFGDVQVTAFSLLAVPKTLASARFVKLAAKAAREAYQKDPVYKIATIGGNSAPLDFFRSTISDEIVSLGVGYAGSPAWSPNEHIRLEDYRMGIQHIIGILEGYAK